MVLLAVRSMGRRLTVPFGRGADTLTLTLDAVDATEAPVAAYNFREHQALYNTLPAARYVLTAHQDVVAATTLTVEYRVLDSFGVPGPVQSVTVDVPAGSVAGSSFAVNLGPDEG